MPHLTNAILRLGISKGGDSEIVVYCLEVPGRAADDVLRRWRTPPTVSTDVSFFFASFGSCFHIFDLCGRNETYVRFVFRNQSPSRSQAFFRESAYLLLVCIISYDREFLVVGIKETSRTCLAK